MVAIPGEFAIQGQNTPTARSGGVAVTDLGLDQVAADLRRVAAAKQRTSQVEAEVALGGAREAFVPAFKMQAETYDGQQPGFAAAQVQAWDDHVAAQRADLGTEARDAFDALNLGERLKVVEQAGGVEAAASGRLVQEARKADQLSRVGALTTQFLVDTQAAAQDAFVKGDPTSPDFIPDQLAAIDGRIKAALDTARPEDKASLQAHLANQRADAQLMFASAGRQLSAARVVDNTQKAIGSLVNGVTSDPAFLDAALKKSPDVLAALPADLRQKAAAEMPATLAAAALEGLRNREDWHGLQTRLDDPRFKKMLAPDQFARFSQIAKTALTSEARSMAAVTVGNRLDAELASLRETGQSTGFDPATLTRVYGPVEGPARVAQAQQQIGDARTVFQTVGDAAGLTASDLTARLNLLKPAAGDADYARKKAVYDHAADVATRLMALRQTDPALAVQADKTSEAMWRAASDGVPATAQAWAEDALRRQAALGIPEAQRAVLPLGEAKRLIKGVVGVDDPVSKATALSQTYAYAQRYGANSGRVLMELQRAGMPAAETAVINAVDGDEVVVGAYARALTKAPQVKLTPDQKTKLGDAVEDELKPLTDSFAGSRDGLAYANALSFAVTTMARANMGDDQSVREAAKAAARHFVGRYVFDAKTGNRIPSQEAHRQIMMVPGTTSENLYNLGELASSGRMDVKPRAGDAELAVRVGSFRLLRDLVGEGGKALAPIAGGGTPLDEGQRRARYADQVAHDGRWVTSPDDSGQQLMLRDPRGGFIAVFGKDGKPIVRSWSQIYERAGKP